MLAYTLKAIYLLLTAILIIGCSSNPETPQNKNQKYQSGHYIQRKHGEYAYTPAIPTKVPPKTYPWDKNQANKHFIITKEYFRCKGSSMNSSKTTTEKGENKHYHDCGGSERHSLPMRDGKEFIYPILIDLLNYIQTKLQKRVVITSGYRCPDHNTYVDSSPENRTSKHMVGAEVAFYVQGLEDKPEVAIQLIQDYYKENTAYQDQKDYMLFQRYDKGDTNISTLPWYNKEVFVKLFSKTEGRDFDNRHPYPYISIQVRYDRERNERVIYTWDKAHRGYHRW